MEIYKNRATSPDHNDTVNTLLEGLRYLAEKPRPDGGSSRFNSEHLYQLADELEKIIKAYEYRDTTQKEVLGKAATAMGVLRGLSDIIPFDDSVPSSNGFAMEIWMGVMRMKERIMELEHELKRTNERGSQSGGRGLL